MTFRFTFTSLSIILGLITIFMIAGLYAWIFIAGIQYKQDKEIELLNAMVENEKVIEHNQAVENIKT